MGDVKKDSKKEKKKKKKQEQRNRKHSSEDSDGDKRYYDRESRSSVETETTMSDEESSVANEVSLDMCVKVESDLTLQFEDGFNDVTKRMTKAEKKNAKKKKKKQQAEEKDKKCTDEDEELCECMSEKEDNEENDNDNGWGSDVTVDNKREEISLEFEDMDGHWEEAKKGKKKKKQGEKKKKNLKMADLVADLESCMHTKTAITESPASSDEAGIAVDNDENKENSSVPNGKLERRTVCHKGLRKEVLMETTIRETRPPRARPPITLVSAFSTNKCSRLEVRSLADMLEEEERDEKKVVEQIPDDVIIRFLLSADETAKRRKELRENLRRRFADFCNCHHARNCPSKSF